MGKDSSTNEEEAAEKSTGSQKQEPVPYLHGMFAG